MAFTDDSLDTEDVVSKHQEGTIQAADLHIEGDSGLIHRCLSILVV